jgi:hypothetical protein
MLHERVDSITGLSASATCRTRCSAFLGPFGAFSALLGLGACDRRPDLTNELPRLEVVLGERPVNGARFVSARLTPCGANSGEWVEIAQEARHGVESFWRRHGDLLARFAFDLAPAADSLPRGLTISIDCLSPLELVVTGAAVARHELEVGWHSFRLETQWD